MLGEINFKIIVTKLDFFPKWNKQKIRLIKKNILHTENPIQSCKILPKRENTDISYLLIVQNIYINLA